MLVFTAAEAQLASPAADFSILWCLHNTWPSAGYLQTPQVWIGYNQSLRPCQSGLTFKMDITAAAFLEGQPMLQLIANWQHCGHAECLWRPQPRPSQEHQQSPSGAFSLQIQLTVQQGVRTHQLPFGQVPQLIPGPGAAADAAHAAVHCQHGLMRGLEPSQQQHSLWAGSIQVQMQLHCLKTQNHGAAELPLCKGCTRQPGAALAELAALMAPRP
ncbi:TPA: Protein argonaute-3 [Trebouxia sp. C0005]